MFSFAFTLKQVSKLIIVIDICNQFVVYLRDFRFLNMADVISEISDNIA